MKITIASGKGGTGKTTVATNLAWVASQNGLATAYLDCDTEAPNGHLFLRPAIQNRREVTRSVPQVDSQLCIHCGQCSEVCQFSAIVGLGQKVLVFPELCHGCGGCQWVCPSGAITEVPRGVGILESGVSGTLQFLQGRLNIGETSSPPVIRAAKQAAPRAELLIFDAPPGTSCPMIETVRGSDFVVLVTEPTPFGLHDLRLAVQVVKLLKINYGVVINRALPGASEIRQFCQQSQIRILAEIPDILAIAEAYSEGKLAVEAVPGLRRSLTQLLWRVLSAGNGISLAERLWAKQEPVLHPLAESAAPGPHASNNVTPAACFLNFRKGAGDRFHSSHQP